jgi:cytochrome c oxidase cbb3-type subunit 3
MSSVCDRTFLGVLGIALLATTGCRSMPAEAANDGAPPAVPVAVGPVPGPGQTPASPTNPYSGNPVALTQGRQLFVYYNCYGCHGGRGGGGMGPSLRDPTWIYGNADAQVFDSIAEGRGKGMPAWGTKIPQEQIWKLVAYLKSMRTPSEPDAPEQR